MQIAGFQKTSTLDYPKKLAAVIFASGCNYRCFYCHNRHILEKPELIKEEEVIAFLEKRQGLLDAVVFSGGEPTLQKDIAWWFNRAKKLGYLTKLDTNGSRPGVLRDLVGAGLVDYVAMDYKAPFSLYKDICFASAEGVRESYEYLASSGVGFELRTTVVPLLTETELIAMARELPTLPKWALQLYREQVGDSAFLKGREPYTPGMIAALAEKVRAFQPNVAVRA